MAYHLNREDGNGIEGAAHCRQRDGEATLSLSSDWHESSTTTMTARGDSQNAVIFNSLVTEWQRIREKMTDDVQLNIPI